MPEILAFPYYGPNRHSDKRVIEFRLSFNDESKAAFPNQVSDIHQLLLSAGILREDEPYPAQALVNDRLSSYSSLLVQTALLFQRKSGHRVDFTHVIPDGEKKRCMALMEHENADVGIAAAKLTVELFTRKQDSLKEAYEQFSKFAGERVLPFETEAIIDAAKRRDIPFFQLDRAPLNAGIKTGFRVRPNGLLHLGHGPNSTVLDGTFCLSRAGDFLKALLRNPDQRAAILKQLGMKVAHPNQSNCMDTQLFQLLVINGKVTALIETTEAGKQLVQNVHCSIIEQSVAISEKVGFLPIVVTYRSTGVSLPLSQTGGTAVDFELGPDLYKFFEKCPANADLLATAADELIDWLFPDPKSSRIPIIAVTGTNGKTTTSRMIRHVLQHNANRPGLVCTDGIFINNKQITAADHGTFRGHATVLTNKGVDSAVLETHHRGIAVHGFAFSHCDVAVCLNVTEEHLAVGEIETVEEMAGIKRALVERGSHAVVLFADDGHCMNMLEFLKSKVICLVSLRSSVAQLREIAGGKTASFCVLESIENDSWVILYDRERRLPVMPVSNIPATFNGTAVVNVSNAMHAIAACYYAGVEIGPVKSALRLFSAGQEFTPGRMNEFDGLPFRLIMDFAHNPDGIQKICEFVDLQNVKGRKIIAFAGMGKRSDDHNRKIARAVAGHFDFYFCKDYEPSQPPKRRFTGPFMQQVLIEEGVPREATTVVTFGKDVTFKILESCRPGDLLLFLAGHSEMHSTPGYIQALQERLKNRGT